MNRKEKEQTISELQKQIEQCKGAVLTNFRGLKVEQMNQIRQRLRGDRRTAGEVSDQPLLHIEIQFVSREDFSRL